MCECYQKYHPKIHWLQFQAGDENCWGKREKQFGWLLFSAYVYAYTRTEQEIGTKNADVHIYPPYIYTDKLINPWTYKYM